MAQQPPPAQPQMDPATQLAQTLAAQGEQQQVMMQQMRQMMETQQAFMQNVMQMQLAVFIFAQ